MNQQHEDAWCGFINTRATSDGSNGVNSSKYTRHLSVAQFLWYGRMWRFIVFAPLVRFSFCSSIIIYLHSRVACPSWFAFAFFFSFLGSRWFNTHNIFADYRVYGYDVGGITAYGSRNGYLQLKKKNKQIELDIWRFWLVSLPLFFSGQSTPNSGTYLDFRYGYNLGGTTARGSRNRCLCAVSIGNNNNIEKWKKRSFPVNCS